MKKAVVTFMLLAMIYGLCTSCTTSALIPVNLRTEYQNNPIGIDNKTPRFTCELKGEDSSFFISGYEVKIRTDSGKYIPFSKITLSPHTKYHWRIRAWDRQGRKSRWSEEAVFETGKFCNSDWKALWITDEYDKEYEPAPMFRKAFVAQKEITEAKVYICASGYYEMFINEQRVGNHMLDPGYTHFDKRILYVTHNVTGLLKKGSNAICAVLGNGWYNCQSKGVWNLEKARWRNRPALKCEIHIKYSDDTEEILITDDTWKTAVGPYTYNNLYSGDRYDARLEKKGWKDTGYNDMQWKHAKVVDNFTQLLVGQQMPPIRVVRKVTPIEMKKLDDNRYLFDMGENITGFCSLNVKGRRGTRVILNYGEMLDNKGYLSQSNINYHYKPVKKGEHFQSDEYILKGEPIGESYTPSFTYHGFRYVEIIIDGKIDPLTCDDIEGLFIHTDMKRIGHFECSNPMLNKLYNATMQSYCGNAHSIPTDCPQREKNGWTADAHVAVDLGLLNYDGIGFYEKWMNDFIDNQNKVGDIAGIIPTDTWGYGMWVGPVWDAALFIIPNALYAYYGDTTCIARLYPTMKRYLDYLLTEEREGILPHGIGDWVPWKAKTNNAFTSTVFYYNDYILMERFASLIGEDPKPYRQKAVNLKNIINKRFFNDSTKVYANGTQAAQAVALYYGIVPEKERQTVAANLNRMIVDNNYFLDFGLLGSKTVLRVLAEYGYEETAWKMVCKKEKPSWGYWIDELGLTTLPEDWPAGTSLNHVFLGDVSAWMTNYLAGINFDINQPGFSHVMIKPHFIEDLEWVKAEYYSVKGMVKTHWYRKNGKIELNVTIPAGCSATINVKGKLQNIGGGCHRFIF